ncbi:KISc [Geosmithia morbida]|uniref:KISc n=1 Tax=Geosmithia morbida TaxID=1094350 RepID=A0A9P5D019_9HYPO|nr:KISc [Geosmithia morbida]KAF4122253.1 KISc [Geosmithia morbida]
MEASNKSSHNLFEVFLRLRPPPVSAGGAERILNVEPPEAADEDRKESEIGGASHVTLNPPSDRRRAIERFGFTRVFEEQSTQLDVFNSTQIPSFIQGVLAPHGGEGTDAVVATLGVTGSGKTHTILGSKTQRGLAQMSLDVLFQSIGPNMLDSYDVAASTESLQSCDPSEASLVPAVHFLEAACADSLHGSRSRAPTPMIGESIGRMSPAPTRRNMQRPSTLPQTPDVSSIQLLCDPLAEYAVVLSMYEVHNDRIYDLLTPPFKSATSKDVRRRPLLFKSTELSPDRKVVAGLRKVVCTTFKEAIMVLEAGLQERRVSGTGSNSTSSRSHGFFSFEVMKRTHSRGSGSWGGNRLTIVDLAGSERARDAKTAGATLAEAGKINESLMYLGQCLQTQSEAGTSSKPNIVPYRQCKLTELLFSNSFPSPSAAGHSHVPRRNPQRGVMIVTADPLGDFNATSQILRYSALAREVTVPRIPSITATILANAPPASPAQPPSPIQPTYHPRPFMPPGSNGSYHNVTPDERVTMELAALEIARLSDDIDHLRSEVEQQMEARMTAEAHLLSMEDRMLDLEAAIRDDCASEFEQRLAIELARFKASLAVEQERSEEYWNMKVDVLERGLEPHEDGDKENVLVESLEEEVERLRRENSVLRRELAGRSPSKRRPLEEREDYSFMSRSSASSSPQQQQTSPSKTSQSKNDNNGAVANLGRKLERMHVSGGTGANAPSGLRNASAASNGSPKKARRLGNKKWEYDDE